MTSERSQTGQASAELVAVMPFALLATLAVVQLGLIGFAAWNASGAARAGARAALVGGNGERVALNAVPSPFHAEASVAGSRVRLEVRPPSLLPGIRMPAVTSAAGLDPAPGAGP